MCNMSLTVNLDKEEIELQTEICLALASFYDSPLPSHHDGMPEKCDSKPEECATKDAPIWE